MRPHDDTVPDFTRFVNIHMKFLESVDTNCDCCILPI